VESQEFDEMLRALLRIAAHQEAINVDLRACIQEQREFNRQQLEINRQQQEFNADVRTTLARIETLVARMLPTGENGREA
jgi:hypothetical protein